MWYLTFILFNVQSVTAVGKNARNPHNKVAFRSPGLLIQQCIFQCMERALLLETYGAKIQMDTGMDAGNGDTTLPKIQDRQIQPSSFLI